MHKQVTEAKTLYKIPLHILIGLFCVFCTLPLILVIVISISNEKSIIEYGYTFFPRNVTLDSYRFILSTPQAIISAYRVSTTVSFFGTLLGLLLSSSLAYVLSRQDYKLKNFTAFFVFFTLLFNGGLVPWYIVITRYLNLANTIYVMFLPYAVNAWFVLLLRTFFKSIPTSLIESAKIDGAMEIRILFQIVYPLAKPALATVGLLYLLMFWNDWWLSLLFIEDRNLVPLQNLLYRIVTNVEFLTSAKGRTNIGFVNTQIPTQGVRMATVILAAGPMLLAFPFFQKYIVKGLTVGSIKG